MVTELGVRLMKMDKTLEKINDNLVSIANVLDQRLPAIEKAIRACAKD